MAGDKKPPTGGTKGRDELVLYFSIFDY